MGPRGSGDRVRQSFSHGRSKSVVVEKKRKFNLAPKPGAAPAAPAEARPAAAKPAAAPAAPSSTSGSAAPAAPQGQARPASGGQAQPSGRAPSGGGARPAGGSSAKPRGRVQGKGQMLRTLSEEEYARRLKALEAAKANEADRRKREAEEEQRRIEEMDKLREEKEAREREEREREIRREREEAAAREAAEAEAKRVEEEKARTEAKAARAAATAKTADPAAVPGRAPRGTEVPGDDRAPRGATPVPARRERPAGGDDRPGGKAAKGADRRNTGKLTINQALAGGDGAGRQRSMAQMRRRQEREKRKMFGSNEPREKVVRDVQLPDAITVQELANRMAERTADVVKWLMQNGIMATQNQTIDPDTAALIIEEFGHKVVRVSDSDVEDAIETTEDSADSLKPRAPVVTIMGHVDHGKTSLLDAIRKTSVVSGEAGGITQHIGAYQITIDSGAKITFLDTPGHAAFTSMRARGAQVTDIVVLVVAADDSVMPQTIEAIAHAKAAGVPMIVAINKTDKPDADPQRVRVELLQHEVVVEAMSGDVLDVEVSAHTGKGLDVLLENIALQAEILDLRANPDRPAEGAVIEAKLDTGRGPVATVLVQRGTLRRGDVFVVGEQWGKVRALMNDQGERVDEAGPSVPVEVLGLHGTPEAGDTLNVVESEAKAREIADYRSRVAKERQAAAGARGSLETLLAQAKADSNVAELPIVVKGDVQGSVEAIVQAMEKVGNDEVRVRVLHSGVGAITESDVTLAEASNAPIIGFNVRANAPARESANQKGVEIRYYSIIYNLVDDIKAAASGLLSPEVKETFIGYAAIKQVFKVTGVGKVAGCEVTEGVARRDAGVRLLRDNVVIHEGKLKTLKRFKDEVREVRAGQECGMAFENYEDIREGDVIEIFTTEEVERTLD
ncbi:translation initiation factor IF-2 [Oceanicella sp. SM1341]|uniref:translation initiation factor IF-2 n=1 Tax=Oceanicella sp. SM1341 TaxID=1548889 RepID=UPI000E505A0B|nr:translation initiation factor IF-2 [Oceanicella sp. SM1341]